MHRPGSRHTPAFLLLFLNEGPSHGAGLLARMESELPHSFADSAGLYRALQSLEREGSVETSWETQEAGAPRKIYRITPSGLAALEAFAEDIRRREENLGFFLERYFAKKHD